MQTQYSKEKLEVILLSTDQTQQIYDSRAEALFSQYGGGNWPSVLLGGFQQAIPFGDFGYGIIVVDKEGIVRAVNAYNLEATLEEVFAED